MKKVISFIMGIAVTSQVFTLPTFAMNSGSRNTNSIPKQSSTHISEQDKTEIMNLVLGIQKIYSGKNFDNILDRLFYEFMFAKQLDSEGWCANDIVTLKITLDILLKNKLPVDLVCSEMFVSVSTKYFNILLKDKDEVTNKMCSKKFIEALKRALCTAGLMYITEIIGNIKK